MADDQSPWKDEDDYKEYQSLLKKNATKAQILSTQGVGLDGPSMLQNRLELFIEIMCPFDDRRRLDFELAFQRKIAASLADADRAIARATLLQQNNGGGNVIQIPRS
jgi:hypothetical protein